MDVKIIRQYLIQKTIPSRTYRRRLVKIGSLLLFAIIVLAIIQWAVGTRGWDFSAGLLTIVMVTLGFALAGVFLQMLPGRQLIDGEMSEIAREDPASFVLRAMHESIDNDPRVVGSKMYRIITD